jgi:hypothetical protein
MPPDVVELLHNNRIIPSFLGLIVVPFICVVLQYGSQNGQLMQLCNIVHYRSSTSRGIEPSEVGRRRNAPAAAIERKIREEKE